MSRAICTIASGPHRALYDVTGPALERYARRYGYEFVAVHGRVAPSRPAAWDKIPLLHDLCEVHDLVVWVDTDALVVDADRDIADDLAANCFLALVEHHLGEERIPNSGVMVLRGDRSALRFLDDVWKTDSYTHHKWWENAAILHVLGYRVDPPVVPVRTARVRTGVQFLDRRWNSIPDDPAPDPAIVHFPGIPLAERLARLDALASRV